MRYVLLIAILALVCSSAQVSMAAPSINSLSTDRAFFNPDTGSVEISYQLADIVNGCPVIIIYGQSGKVKEIPLGTRSTGNYSVAWDGTNGNGVAVPDGEYSLLVYMAGIDSVKQPRLIKVFASPAMPEEQVQGLISGTAVNSSGYMYVADTANNSVVIYSPEGALVSRFGAGGTGDGEFMSPVDVAVNASDYVFVSDDYNARVQAFGPEGRFVASWQISPEPDADYTYAGPIAVNSSGYIYVVSNGERKLDNAETPWTPDRQYYNRIQVFSPGGEHVGSFGSYGSEESQFGSVGSLAIDRDGHIYVADMLNHRVLILDPQGNFITLIDHSSVGLGDSYNPGSVGIGSSGHVYTIDESSARVDVFSPIVVNCTRVSIDKTPPYIDAIMSSKMANGSHSTSVTVDLEAEDAGSGVKEIDYILDDGPVHRITGASTTFVVTNGVHKLDYWSTDNVGNEGKHNSIIVNIDAVPPVTRATVTGTGGDNGWYRSDVVVNLSAEDAGTGVHKTQHSFDGSRWFYGTRFTVSTEGLNTVYYRSVDNAGNTENPNRIEVMIDKTVPSIGCRFDGAWSQGWFTSDVTTTLTPADNESGIARTEYSRDGISWANYTSAFTIPPGHQNKVCYRTFDVAGNVATGSSFVYFWSTSIPDIHELVNLAPAQATPLPATITTAVPAYWRLPSSGRPTVTPSTTPMVLANETDRPSGDEYRENVKTIARILRIIAGFAGFLP